MPTVSLAPHFKQQYSDSDGNPLAGGKIYTYQSGTSTPQATYTDSTGTVANANPVILDASGEADIWFDVELSYKVVVKDSNDVTIDTRDGMIGLLTNNSVPTAALQDLSVTMPKLGLDSVGADQLRDDASVDANRAVTTNHIRDGAATMPKIGVFNALATDSSPDGSADYVPTYDASDAANKKVLLNKVGSLVLIQTQTANASTSIDFTSGIDSTYEEYVLVAKDVTPVTNATNLYMRISEDSGANWKAGASDYRYAIQHNNQAAVAGNLGSTGTTQMLIANSLGSSTPMSLDARIHIFSPSGSVKNKLFVGDYTYLPSDGVFQMGKIGAMYAGSVNAINGIRLLMSSGNISSGTFSLYGVRK